MQRHQRAWRTRASAAANITVLAAACHRAPGAVDPGALQVRADVTPHELAASAHPDTGSVEVAVSVTNPRLLPVAVRLEGAPDPDAHLRTAPTDGVGFGVRVLAADRAAPDGPSVWMAAHPTVLLGPRATLRQTFVIPIATADRAGGGSVGPGTYRVVASFGRLAAPPVTLRVLP